MVNQEITDDFTQFFSTISGEAAGGANIQGIPNDTNNEAVQDVNEFKTERRHHAIRVNNMRMQFAWAAILLAFGWILTIIYIILSHAIGSLYIRQFHSIMWGIAGAITLSSILYGIFMAIHIRHQYRSHILKGAKGEIRKHLSTLYRSLAPNLALILSPPVALITYLVVWNTSEALPPISFARLSDSVLIAIITTTTISVLGILGSVMFWLFPRNQNDIIKSTE